MTKKDDTFYIHLNSIDTVLQIHRFEFEEAREVVREGIKLIKDSSIKESILVVYTRFLLDKLLLNPRDLLHEFDVLGRSPNVDEEQVNIYIQAISEIYVEICKIYPEFTIENICGLINEGANLDKRQPPPKKPKKSDDINAVDDFLSFMSFLDFVDVPDEELIQKVRDGKTKSKKSVKKTSKAKETKERTRKDKKVLTLKEINKLERGLKKNIIGQDEAIESLIRFVKLIHSGIEQRGSFMFIGPTGVGKTHLARLFAMAYCGNFFMINCAEYSHGHEIAKLLGAPPGYMGHNDKSIMSEKAAKSNRWVFLFDEFEKADNKLRNLLLGLLEEGKIVDNNGNECDFSESIFIFTSNQGLKDVKLGVQLGFNSKSMTYDDSKESLLDSYKQAFSPEFRNRIDELIYFRCLSKDDCKKIAELELQPLPVDLKKNKAKLLNFIVNNTYSEEYGAREIKRFIKKNISLPVAECILDEYVPTESPFYQLDVSRGKIKIINVEKMKKLSSVSGNE